jgi:hypothetical protein
MKSCVITIAVFMIVAMGSSVSPFWESDVLPSLIKKIQPAVVKITVYDQGRNRLPESVEPSLQHWVEA